MIAAPRLAVDVVALDGVLDAALGVVVDVLGAANRIAIASGATPPFAVTLVSVGPSVRTGSGLRVETQARIGQRRPDVLVVLGMNVPTREEVERTLDRPDARVVLRAIRRAALRGALVCGACSATFLLAEAGVLDGGRATTSWWLGPYFRARYPAITLCEDAMVVGHAGRASAKPREPTPRRGGVVTAGAALAHVDLMLWLTRHVAGPSVAALCTRYLVVDERASQTRYAAIDQLVHDSEEVRRAELFARRGLDRPIGIADLARAAGISERTLERKFRATLGLSPSRFLQRLRAERAAHLLTTSSASVERIAERVGYASALSLRRVLARELGTSPTALRRSPRR